MAYPYLVSSAWYVVSQLVEDWQANPYRWERERDIQVELSNRLVQLLRLIGDDTVEGRYSNVISGYEENQIWSRVCCEPHVTYTYSDGERYRCHPDVVIWDDIEDPEDPPEDWPILWACEIKYGKNAPSQWDIKKLEYLVESKQVRFGCWLTLRFSRAEKGTGIKWVKNRFGNRLWTCEAWLPSE